jgi:cytochrome c oxidase assembly protein subunit 11
MKEPSRRRNLRVVLWCASTIAVMLGLVAYSPTLYRLICAGTGLGGATQKATAASETVSDRSVTVRFDSNVAQGLPWRFEPLQREVRVHLGEQQLVFFTAENLSDETVIGRATFNVTPEETGIYFKKIQCFCFDEERLDARQKVDMPLVFFVDPALAGDPGTADINTITLSYTFYRSNKPEKAKDLSRFLATAEPDAAHGEELFGERCSVCHALDRNKAGPMLGGVVGRATASAVRYNYSTALAQANLTWTADNLDRWLADPQKFLPGTRMPIRVLERSSRRDIIGYLENESRKANDRSTPQTVAQHRVE